MIRLWCSVIAIGVSSALPVSSLAAGQPNYQAVKVAISELKGDQVLTPLAPYGPRKMQTTCWARSGCGVADGCTILDTYLPSKGYDTRAGNYAYIADIAVVYERALTRLGYPRSVWGATISDFEAYEVARASRMRPFWDTRASDKYKLLDEPFSGVLGERLQAALKRYQAAHPRLHGLAFAGGCGAGSIAVKIATLPLATQVFIIPKFYYLVCRAQGVEPENMSACDHWREVTAPVEQVSGSYHYVARWPDGVVRRGVLDFNGAHNDSITLKKP